MTTLYASLAWPFAQAQSGSSKVRITSFKRRLVVRLRYPVYGIDRGRHGRGAAQAAPPPARRRLKQKLCVTFSQRYSVNDKKDLMKGVGKLGARPLRRRWSCCCYEQRTLRTIVLWVLVCLVSTCQAAYSSTPTSAGLMDGGQNTPEIPTGSSEHGGCSPPGPAGRGPQHPSRDGSRWALHQHLPFSYACTPAGRSIAQSMHGACQLPYLQAALLASYEPFTVRLAGMGLTWCPARTVVEASCSLQKRRHDTYVQRFRHVTLSLLPFHASARRCPMSRLQAASLALDALGLPQVGIESINHATGGLN